MSEARVTDPSPLSSSPESTAAGVDPPDLTSEVVGTYVALDWYDGPLVEIAPVVLADGDRMVQVRSLCLGDDPWQQAMIRLTREDLRKMLDMIDGKPVRGCLDR